MKGYAGSPLYASMYHQHDNHGYWTLSPSPDNNGCRRAVAVTMPKKLHPESSVTNGGTDATSVNPLNMSPGGTTNTMRNGLATTVPQSMIQHELDCRHRPLPRRSTNSSNQSHTNCFLRCCHVHVLLVVSQLLLGGAVTALAFYTETLTTTVAPRDCPYWAGIPLLMASVLGVYFCATNFTPYSRSVTAFTVKALFFTLSAGCAVLCMTAGVFCAIHTARIASFVGCRSIASTCICVASHNPRARIHLYEVTDCDVLRTSVKEYLILQSALNVVASVVSFALVVIIWKSRYEGFHSGLRFYSYNASLPPHPWFDPSNPPYLTGDSARSPLTVRKLSERRSDTSSTRLKYAHKLQELDDFDDVFEKDEGVFFDV